MNARVPLLGDPGTCVGLSDRSLLLLLLLLIGRSCLLLLLLSLLLGRSLLLFLLLLNLGGRRLRVVIVVATANQRQTGSPTPARADARKSERLDILLRRMRCQ